MRTHYKKLLVSVVFLILVSSLTGASCRALFGSLQIKSSPEKATVFINGENTEKETPTNIRLPKGSYTLKLTKEGYLDYETTVQINIRQKTEVDATLILENSQVYRNEKYGYSFVYPEEWNIDDSDSEIIYIRSFSNVEEGTSGVGGDGCEVVMLVEENSDDLSIEDWAQKEKDNNPDYHDLSVEDKTFGDNTWKKVIFTGDFQGTGFPIYMTCSNKKFYSASYKCINEKRSQEYMEDFELILANFAF